MYLTTVITSCCGDTTGRTGGFGLRRLGLAQRASSPKRRKQDKLRWFAGSDVKGLVWGGGESGLQGLLIGRKALESCTNILQRRKPPVWRPLGGKDKWRKSTGLPSRTSKFSLISVTWELGCREAGTEPSGLGPRFLVRTQRDAHFTGRLTWDSAAEMFCARRT